MPICLGRSLCLSQSLRCARLQFHLWYRTISQLHDATTRFAHSKRYLAKSAHARKEINPTRPVKATKETLVQRKDIEAGATRKETGAEEKEGRSRDSPAKPHSSPGSPNDPAALWIEALEPFLPSHLRSSSHTTTASSLDAEKTCTGITNLLAEARESDAQIDILATLGVRDGRWSAVMTLVECLITDATSRIPNSSSVELPSNLDWPRLMTLDDMARKAFEVDQMSHSNRLSYEQWDEIQFDPRYTDQMRMEKYNVIEQIWMSLGAIILGTTALPSEKSSKVMMHVQRIIARLHNSGFVPDHVYSYSYSCTDNDSAVRRPPLMHLLSSRILTSLSDAVLRAHHDEVNALAANAGSNYRGLAHILPGAQARLKVRDLGPEIWLEFVLWCCVDGGFAKAGSWIVEQMRTRNTDLPWFAVHLTSSSGEETLDAALIDWASVNKRPGGILSRTRGDLGEKASDADHSCSISAEVVLALVEVLIDSRSPGISGRGTTQKSILTSIEKLLMFLEPHSLPEKYLDYLTVRLFQPLLYDFEKDPTTLQALSERLGFIRSLESTRRRSEYLPSLQVDSVLEQSEVYPGLLHQILETLAIAGRANSTVNVFNQIQDLVDQSKLRSIGSFLQSPRRPDQDFFSDFAFSREYTSSHGQLPAQKLAAFLGLVTDAGLTELGQWLLYSMDVDGPLIPLTLYGQGSVSPSVLRFAGATNDHMLQEDVADAVRSKAGKPPVSFLRSYVDAQLRQANFETAGHKLAYLNEAKGGGYSLSNIANLLATITKIEKYTEHDKPERRARLLSPGLSLLDWLLEGDFRGNVGDFKKSQIKDHFRGLACLFRVAETMSGSLLSGVARSWIQKLAQSNVVGLNARVFNILLAALVETRGARFGMMIWDLFCEEPRPDDESIQERVPWANTKPDSTADDLSNGSPLSGSELGTRDVMPPTKANESHPRSSTSVGANLKVDVTEEGAMFADDHLEQGVEEDSDTHFTDFDAGVNESGLDLNVSSPPRISPAFSGLAARARSVAGKGSVPEEDLMLEVEPPSADITIPSTEFNGMVSEELFPSESMDDDILPLASTQIGRIPVVKPTFATLRIIIRAALEELEAAEKLVYVGQKTAASEEFPEYPAKKNMLALEATIINVELVEQWAKPLFQRFGLSDEDVAVEFGRKLDGKGNIFSTEELHRRYSAAQAEYEQAKESLAAKMSRVYVGKNFLNPRIRKTAVNVKEFTPRELLYYHGVKY